MFRSLSNDEYQLLEERRKALYTSEWIIDNLTAVMMDPAHGSSGLHEATARAKAEAVIQWFKVIGGTEVPAKRPK